MKFLRIMGKILLFIAFAALAYDGARIVATPGEGILLTSVSKHLQTNFSGLQDNFRDFMLAHAPSYIWSGIVEPLLILPVSIVCGALGVLSFLAGYRKPPPVIISDEMDALP